MVTVAHWSMPYGLPCIDGKICNGNFITGPYWNVHWIPRKIQVHNMLCTKKCFFCFDIQNNVCTQHVLNLYLSCNSMNNLSSYCGLLNWFKNESFWHRFTCIEMFDSLGNGRGWWWGGTFVITKTRCRNHEQIDDFDFQNDFERLKQIFNMIFNSGK